MNNILQLIDRLSFRRLFSYLGLFTLLLFIPFAWWASVQRHTLGSRAGLEPTLMPTPIIYGALPSGTPVIKNISPFFGKAGDEVLIQGENFGTTPPNSEIRLGDLPITQIIRWEEGEIVFALPEGAVSGNLQLLIGAHRLEWERPLTVYDANTLTRVSLQGNHLTLLNPAGITKVALWANEATQPEYLPLPEAALSSWLSPLRYNSFNWITLYDAQNQIKSFFIDPLEML